MSIWGASRNNDTHRCGDCNDAIALLIPHIPSRAWDLTFFDRAAYEAWTHRVVRMTRAELDELAGPLLTRLGVVYRAFTALLDAADPAMVRDKVATLADSTDLFNGATISNWWAAHCYSQSNQA